MFREEQNEDCQSECHVRKAQIAIAGFKDRIRPVAKKCLWQRQGNNSFREPGKEHSPAVRSLSSEIPF